MRGPKEAAATWTITPPKTCARYDRFSRMMATGSGKAEPCGNRAAATARWSCPIREAGIPCCASDIVDRGCPDSWVADYYSCLRSRGGAIITNPPYREINARDGGGRWLRHALDMPGWDYMALLLSWDWPAARINGLGNLLDQHPFTHVYLLRYKVDFTGGGAPPQRNAWFIWDRRDPRSRPGLGPHRNRPSDGWTQPRNKMRHRMARKYHFLEPVAGVTPIDILRRALINAAPDDAVVYRISLSEKKTTMNQHMMRAASALEAAGLCMLAQERRGRELLYLAIRTKGHHELRSKRWKGKND